MSTEQNDQPQGAYDDAILDSNAISPTDETGNPIPVTIPIALAPGVTVVYTTRLGGISTGDFGDCNLGGKSGDDPHAILANRVALAKQIGCGLSLVSQVHSAVAVDVDDSWHLNTPFGFDVSGTPGEVVADAGGEQPQATVVEADGQVTTRTGVALGMFAADCLPVLFADAESGVIGAAHCGRRGLERGVIGETVDLMVAKGAVRERIVATLGPRICGDCYEVGDEIAESFQNRFPLTRTITRFGGAGIDIAEAAMIDLAFAGVNHVVDSRPRVAAATQYLDHDAELASLCESDGEGPALAERLDALQHSMCTLENPLWYSHRRAALAGKKREGRMLALIMRSER
ncbi:polyphenol oxidase family protein [Bifidobacterium jacchi]|uniref:Laccase domain-containing protein n=1 Tax=Bifidobacterium jacchi TaxID=2490545 RepID=A0A5N5RGC6_9BIFI|nr:polyphenol oxidase family protein [Bifidobacterium jacchi]KAB5606259.1 laccase domain-containing protein [Bifidobacterium jacchi]